MILSDRGIEKAIADGRIVISPEVFPAQFDSSSLNLRVGDDFRMWKADLDAEGITHQVDINSIDLAKLAYLTDEIQPERDGAILIPPEAFVLVRTYEHITLPVTSKNRRAR